MSWDAFEKEGLTEKEGEVLEVVLPRKGQMTYLGKGEACLGGSGVEGNYTD